MATYADPAGHVITIPNAGVEIPGWLNDPRGRWGDRGGGGGGAAGLPGAGKGAAAGGAAAGGTAAGVATAAGGSALTNLLFGLSLAGLALDVFGQLRAGQAAKEIAEFNARVAELRATDAEVRGEEEAARFRLGVKMLIGSQRAGFAGQNVDVGVGSPVDVSADAAFLGALDELQIRMNARREAWGHRMDAENFRLGGQQAQSAARWGAASTALGTGTSILANRYGWGRPN